MKIFLNTNVYDEAIKRINYLFDEFDEVVIANSGGKDSTVIKELTLMVAEQRGRLPVKMLFIDQEVEYRMVIEYMRIAMKDKRVDPKWLQIPLKMPNSLSMYEPYHISWEKGKDETTRRNFNKRKCFWC